jgi:hypothetical protein
MGRGSPVIFNILTVLVLLGVCGAVACFAVVALNPEAVPLPTAFALPPLPTVLPSPLPSPTALIDTFPTEIPASATPTDTEEAETPTATFTLSPTATTVITRTATATLTLSPTVSPTVTRTATRTVTSPPPGPTAVPTNTLSPLPFTLQPGSPAYQPNYANTAGCNWMGVAGQAFDLSGRPIIGLIVRVSFKTGSIDAITGTNKSYGEGGYEVYLNNHVEATDDAYSIQLLNAASSPLSERFGFVTVADCNRNLIIINFVQNH